MDKPITARFLSVEAMITALEPSYPVYCLRPATLAATARDFLARFPGRVLYAVKCNPHPLVLRTLHDAGVRHFDTASLPEIAQVRELFRDAGAYFMHPVKSRATIQSAYTVYGVRDFVIDHPAELAKLVEETGGEEVSAVVRLATPHAGALYDLSTKFGATPALAADLLRAARAEGMRAGLAFHIGSQCLAPTAFRTALEIVGEVIEAAKVDLATLDVGGGFAVSYVGVEAPPLAAYMAEIAAGLAALRLRNDCVVMCEPGRALVASGCSLVVQVQLRKNEQIYINDGIYGSLSEMATARLRYPVRLIRPGEPVAEGTREFTVNGPTCDSFDVLPSPFPLPEDVREGDWIEIDMIGAYSNAGRTRFNGFFPDTFVEIGTPA